jgi:hypothetical protein
MTKFCIAELECAQSYLAGQELGHLLGWSKRRRMYRGPMLPHCIPGGAPVNKAANSEPERVTTVTRRAPSEKE